MLRPVDGYLPRARLFDEGALTEIYRALNRPLYAYAYRLVGDGCEAEDLVAETFRRFLLALRNGGGPREHLAAYLYRTLHNLITDHYRHRPKPDLPLDESLEAADDDPALATPIHIAQVQARAALWRLTSEQRLVITLKYYEGLSNDEVAAALGKPVGAVKSLQHRALEALRRLLADEVMEERVAI